MDSFGGSVCHYLTAHMCAHVQHPAFAMRARAGGGANRMGRVFGAVAEMAGMAAMPDIMPQHKMATAMRAPPAPTHDDKNIIKHADTGASRAPVIPRSDARQTLIWRSGLAARDGKATLTFTLPDSIATFAISVDAVRVGKDGQAADMGSKRTIVASSRAFVSEPKLPRRMTQGDRPKIPVIITNKSPFVLDATVQLKLFSAGIPGLDRIPGGFKTVAAVRVHPESKTRVLVSFEVPKTGSNLTMDIQTHAQAVGSSTGDDITGVRFRDATRHTIQVNPIGFPRSISSTGSLMVDTSPSNSTLTFHTPAGIVRGSFQASVSVYPMAVGKILDVIAALIREPCGCFEQTSSTTYPLVMAIQTMDALKNAAKDAKK